MARNSSETSQPKKREWVKPVLHKVNITSATKGNNPNEDQGGCDQSGNTQVCS